MSRYNGVALPCITWNSGGDDYDTMTADLSTKMAGIGGGAVITKDTSLASSGIVKFNVAFQDSTSPATLYPLIDTTTTSACSNKMSAVSSATHSIQYAMMGKFKLQFDTRNCDMCTFKSLQITDEINPYADRGDESLLERLWALSNIGFYGVEVDRVAHDPSSGAGDGSTWVVKFVGDAVAGNVPQLLVVPHTLTTIDLSLIHI